MAGREGQGAVSIEDTGALAVSNLINHKVGGVTPAVIAQPAGEFLHLVLIAEVGGWRINIGDTSATGSADLTWTIPAADVTDGTGSILMAASDTLVLPAPDSFSCVSLAATDILTYYWI